MYCGNSTFGDGFLPGQVRTSSSAAIRAFEHVWSDRPANAYPHKARIAKRSLPADGMRSDRKNRLV